ncbi:single-stranded DNA-binding protein [Weeksellaceae bacterium KMM 9724]|nr:single-stranded DNA-binding protein [Profundicola chukchiensis]MDG4950952.1 single-stranded DNA-binding protein [Profundicola chukchiensis]
MMSIKNKVQLVGHVGQNPEIKEFGDSGKLARFSLATNEGYRNKEGQWVEQTSWHNLIGWRFVAERIEKYVQKGAYVMIEGKLVNRDYTDKDNVKRYITEVEVENFLILDKKSADSAGSYQSNGTSSENVIKASEEDENFPF